MPMSSTATFTPVPSKPAAHAVGAPICGTLTSRAGLRIASSHTFPDVRPGRTTAQVAASFGRSTVAAYPRMATNGRLTANPFTAGTPLAAGAPFPRAAPFGATAPDTINGRSARLSYPAASSPVTSNRRRSR